MNRIPERSVSLAHAEKAIDNYFLKNNIKIKKEKYGSSLSSIVVTLTFPLTGEESCIGCGKGYDQEAAVGAKYEAYEHHRGLISLRRYCKLVAYHDVVSQPRVGGLLPVKLLAKSQPTHISTIEFPPSAECKQALLWPSFLIDYNYPKNKLAGDNADYQAARRYSCGTGFAAGFGFTEAAIHAVSEVIERHCVGTYLARTFFYALDANLRSVRPESMPDPLRQTYKDAESTLDNEVQLIDISCDTLPPVYIACCRDKPLSGIQVFGSGCSYYASHAANRAIKELVQQHAVEGGVDIVKHEWRKHKYHLQKHPRLLKCLIADISKKNLFPQAIRPDNNPITLENHLQYLLSACAEMGLPVWVKEIDSDPSGVSIACAVMPEMERFSIVSLGNYVVPTSKYRVNTC